MIEWQSINVTHLLMQAVNTKCDVENDTYDDSETDLLMHLKKKFCILSPFPIFQVMMMVLMLFFLSFNSIVLLKWLLCIKKTDVNVIKRQNN